jgi:hypothetical protein
VEHIDAGLPVTQSDDPLSGGHFDLGTSKPPPGPPRESSRIIVNVLGALHMANTQDAWRSVGIESPIGNGLTTVVGAQTKCVF